MSLFKQIELDGYLYRSANGHPASQSSRAFVGMRALLGVVESGMFPMFKYTLSLFYGKKRYGFAIGRMMAIWQVRLRDA